MAKNFRPYVAKLPPRCTYLPYLDGCVSPNRQTDTQNTINFLSNNTIKTMKFMRWCCKKKGEADSTKTTWHVTNGQLNWLLQRVKNCRRRSTKQVSHRDKREKNPLPDDHWILKRWNGFGQSLHTPYFLQQSRKHMLLNSIILTVQCNLQFSIVF